MNNQGLVTGIALIQQLAGPDREVNVARGLERVREAARAGARLVAFAELAFEPFFPRIPAAERTANQGEGERQAGRLSHVRELATTIPGPVTEPFCRLARELGVVIVLNLFERDGDQCFDSSPVIDADGTILGVTRMVHITEYDCFHEQGYYCPGDRGVPVYDTAAGRVGVAICYDRHYPEVMRALGLGGAEIVVVPQAGTVGEWPPGLYEAELQVAAFQNGYFTALVNRVGAEGAMTFAGESFVCDPAGKVIARAAAGEEQLLLADLDRAEIATSHARRLFFQHRRPGIYSGWGLG